MKKHLRLILTIVITLLLGALIIQNHAPVRAELLFVAVEMPLILLLTLTSGLGFMLGVLATYFGRIQPKP
ncbi:MAG: DUF1049 domain-containing protein [Verrucomicrobiales bacterium]|nr:DUF1049 domain-containing protein [Verrucomicrobiales bacterium]